MECWSCGAERGDATFCTTCKVIQPDSKKQTFFEVLGLAPRMSIDEKQLAKAFRERSAKVHPDRFGNKSAVERRLAVQHTARLNEAYRTLKDPQKRAEYLMSLEGVEIGGEEKRTEDPDFLMEMLELQEAADELGSLDEVDAMRSRIHAMNEERMRSVTRYFDEGVGDRDEIARALDASRYYMRLTERLNAKREDLS